MAKRRRAWNEKTYHKYLSEGRGQGVLSEYKPWIYVQDFPSKGIVSRVPGIKTGRVHHLLSKLERAYFHLLDWSDNVYDIREQYPVLDLAAVIEIADKAGIRYPFDNVSGFPYVLTSDFFIVKITGEEIVRSIKLSKDLDNPRTLERYPELKAFFAEVVETKEQWMSRRFAEIAKKQALAGKMLRLSDVKREMSMKPSTYRKYGDFIEASISQINDDNEMKRK